MRSLVHLLVKKGGHRPSLEVHVPGSPTPLFFNMVRCLTLSLRRFGGAYSRAPVIFTVGADQIDLGLADRLPWLKANGIELRWVPTEQFRALSWFATGPRLAQYEYGSDVVLLLDADTLIAGPLDELIEGVARDQVLAGMIAHATPFGANTSQNWEGVFRRCGLGSPTLEHEYTGWGYMSADPEHRYCPTYFNCGVLCAPGRYFREIGRVVELLGRQVLEYTQDPYFKNQIALALAIAHLRLPTWTLPMRYNFANDPLLEALHAAEIPHARILHLLRKHQGIYKTELFADLSNLAAFLQRTDLRVTTRRAQEVIGAIWPNLCDDEGRASGLRSAA